MNQRLGWWTLPAAMLVLLRVVTLDGADAREQVAPVDAAASRDVMVLEAAGRRSAPLPAPVPAVAGAVFVAVPALHAGARGSMTIWRRTAAGREAEPWLEFTPKVPSDATLKIAGLAAGCYDFEWRCGDAVLVAEAAAAPGTVELQPAAAPGR